MHQLYFNRNLKMHWRRLSHSLLRSKTCCNGSTKSIMPCPCRSQWVVYQRRHQANLNS